MTIYGYARVSDEDQNLTQQLAELKAAGCEMVKCEKASAKSTDGREILTTLLEFMHDGDVLIVSKLDRFARSTLDTLTLLTDLAKRGIKFKSLAEPWADTTTPAGELITTVFAGVAQFERRRMLERQHAGIKRARDGQERRDNGMLKYAGRPAKLDRAGILADLRGGMGATAVAEKHGISRRMVYVIRDKAAAESA
jgi:DNA invertase Pin-like site-specific DNA recombinase